jgi:hypothetical protein
MESAKKQRVHVPEKDGAQGGVGKLVEEVSWDSIFAMR